MIDVIVIDPGFLAGIVRRIDVDAFYSSLIFGQQGFERFEIVAMNDLVPAPGFGAHLRAVVKPVLMIQHLKGDIQVMINDFLFPDPM
ncbi:MAG: hypothetical protein PHP04_09010 [Bacteroidales bacterium]|nr:hypothetical protein [Bacteroidales bacterium]